MRYLNTETVAQARGAHREVVSEVRTVARRRGDPAWRLIGVELGQTPLATALEPSVSDWAAAEGLDDWPKKDLIDLYVERFEAVKTGGRKRRAGR